MVGTAALFAKIFLAAKTGTPTLDRWGIRGRVVFQCIKQFPNLIPHPEQLQRVVDAMMAIINNESRGDPRNYIGDDGLPAAGGASVGPGQVSFKTAQALGLVPDSETLDDYKLRAPDEGWGIKASVAVFKDKLTRYKDVPTAIERYNGSGEAAENYEAKALAFARDVLGVDEEADS